MINETGMFVDECVEQVEKYSDEEINVSSNSPSMEHLNANFPLNDTDDKSNDININNLSANTAVKCPSDDTLILENGENESDPLKNPNEIEDQSNSMQKKLTQIPLSRVRNIMKLDREASLMGQGVVFLISKSTVSSVP